MGSQIKALAAAVGGAVGGGGAGAYVLPDGSPWYAYVIMTVAPLIIGYLGTYFAPKNAPAA